MLKRAVESFGWTPILLTSGWIFVMGMCAGAKDTPWAIAAGVTGAYLFYLAWGWKGWVKIDRGEDAQTRD
jgi:hypothetical protein